MPVLSGGFGCHMVIREHAPVYHDVVGPAVPFAFLQSRTNLVFSRPEFVAGVLQYGLPAIQVTQSIANPQSTPYDEGDKQTATTMSVKPRGRGRQIRCDKNLDLTTKNELVRMSKE